MAASFNRTLAAIAGAVCLFAAASADAKKLEAATLGAIKKIAVVSAAGDNLICRATGVTVFGNDYESENVREWNLDAEWQAQLVEAANALGRFEVTPLPTEDRAALLAIEDESAIAEAIRSIASSAGTDAVLLFLSPLTDTYYKEVYLDDYGVFTYSMAFKKRTIYYLSGRLYLYDASGKLLDTQYLPGETPKGLTPLPHAAAPEHLRALCLSAYSPEDREALRSALVEIPKLLWAPALEKLLETK